MPLIGWIAMSGRRTTPRLDAAALAPPNATEQVSAAWSVRKGDERGATTASDAETLAPWLRLVDALADEAARRLWEQGNPATAPRQASTSPVSPYRKGRPHEG